MTAAEALEHVLSGTGLTYKYLDDKTVTILPMGSGAPAADAGGAHNAAQSEGQGGASQAQGGDQKKASGTGFGWLKRLLASNSRSMPVRSPQPCPRPKRLMEAAAR